MNETRTAQDWARLTIGVIARLACWAAVLLIVGNAMAQAISNDQTGLAITEVALFPVTFLVYPFAAEAGHYAWPLADGTSLIPFLIAGVVAYPISTVVGGLEPM